VRKCTDRFALVLKLSLVRKPDPHSPSHLRGGTITGAVIAPAYTMTARVLHWITAFLILSMIPLGVVIANEWGGSAQESLYDLHRSIGAAVIPPRHSAARLSLDAPAIIATR
jgi:hypothetical protein